MSLQSIMDAVSTLGKEISDTPVGDPRLGEIVTRIEALESELRQEMGMSEPLVPDAARPASVEEATAQELAQALQSLHDAAMSRSE